MDTHTDINMHGHTLCFLRSFTHQQTLQLLCGCCCCIEAFINIDEHTHTHARNNDNMVITQSVIEAQHKNGTWHCTV